MNNNKFLSLLNPRITKYIKNIIVENEETSESSTKIHKEYFAYLPYIYGLKNIEYGIFIKLTETELSTSASTSIYEWWMELKSTSDKEEFDNILINGTPNFSCGTDYFMTDSLATYLNDIDIDKRMPDLFNKFGDYSNVTTSDEVNKYDPVQDTYLDMYIKHNDFINIELDIEDLKHICTKFFEIILNYYNDFSQEVSDTSNIKYQLYDKVLNYFNNSRKDNATENIDLIFNTAYYPSDLEYKVLNNDSSSVNCNCGNSSTVSTGITSDTNNSASALSGLSSLSGMSCSDKYFYAMNEYLIMMLSDKDFYCWYLYKYADDTNSSRDPNVDLINNLIELLTNFMKLGYDLSATSQSTHNSCGCGNCNDFGNNSSIVGTTVSKSNYSTIENYIDVLESIKNGNINIEKNKLYLYGRAFGKLLPGLCFN